MCVCPDRRLFRDARVAKDNDLSQSNGAEGSHTHTETHTHKHTLSPNYFNPFREHAPYLRDRGVQ